MSVYSTPNVARKRSSKEPIIAGMGIALAILIAAAVLLSIVVPDITHMINEVKSALSSASR